MNIPILDSSTHPTVTGNWVSNNLNASFEKLVNSLEASNVSKALAVGLHNVEEYDHELFMECCKKYDQLIPIAGLSPLSENIEEEVRKINELGYKGVKIHSRFSGFSFLKHKTQIVKLIEECYKHDLIVFICTYYASDIDAFPAKDPFWEMVQVFKEAPKAKIVLMHGGTIRLLMYADLVRFNPNMLLDLSYSIMKYKGSSVDIDIKYLFNTFDQKICIGSDYPEVSEDKLRERAEELSQGIPKLKKENIFYKNLIKLIKE
jgi:predicted TIM-barrel fold metal-dependent hydrolase